MIFEYYRGSFEIKKWNVIFTLAYMQFVVQSSQKYEFFTQDKLTKFK